MKKFLILLFMCIFGFSAFAAETNKDYNEYEKITDDIKNNPNQAIKQLKKMIDTNDSAAIEYLILQSIYHPKQVKTKEFSQIAQRLHEKLVAQYEKIVPNEPFYRMYQEHYLELVGENPLKCYKQLKCLIEIGALHFSKFFNIWDNESNYINYTPWQIVVPCPTARKLKMTAILDYAGGGHGAEAIDISNCSQYDEYYFPKEVNKFYYNLYSNFYFESGGSSRFVHQAKEKYYNNIYRYNPDWNIKGNEKYLKVMPLEQWAMASYPNYKKVTETLNYGIGFKEAVKQLTQHYVKTFKVSEKIAEQYAHLAMMPPATRGEPVDKSTLRYKILSGAPIKEIKDLLIKQIQGGEILKEPQIPVEADEILMISIHRPDVLALLLQECSENKCKGINTDVNAVNSIGKTALMYAAQYGFLDSVKILLKAGADIDAQTNAGNKDNGYYCNEDICIQYGERTALMYAVQEGNLEVAKYLVENGADLKLTDSQGNDVYDYLRGSVPYGTSSEPKNENLTSEQVEEFAEFLKNYEKEHSDAQTPNIREKSCL